MTDIDIEQTIATGEAKLNALAYSRYLQARYGLSNYCPTSAINCFTLFLWALGAWDNRPGATNPYPEVGIKFITAKINAL